MKSRSHANACYNGHSIIKFDRRLGSVAVEVPVKFQNDWKSLNPSLVASKLNEILGEDVCLVKSTDTKSQQNTPKREMWVWFYGCVIFQVYFSGTNTHRAAYDWIYFMHSFRTADIRNHYKLIRILYELFYRIVFTIALRDYFSIFHSQPREHCINYNQSIPMLANGWWEYIISMLLTDIKLFVDIK